jgi:hypothetical protein
LKGEKHLEINPTQHSILNLNQEGKQPMYMPLNGSIDHVSSDHDALTSLKEPKHLQATHEEGKAIIRAEVEMVILNLGPKNGASFWDQTCIDVYEAHIDNPFKSFLFC